MRQFFGALTAVLIVLANAAMHPAAASEDVDLELVLAVDASGSVDNAEYRLQLSGIAAALRDPAVLRAITAGRHRRIALNVLIWAEARRPKDETGWFILSSKAEVDRVAAMIAAMPRTQVGGTGIGDGVAHAIRSIDENAIRSDRRIVDVSGDGRETPPRQYSTILSEARSMAIARNVTLNGLAILNEDKQLDDYYRAWLAVGEGNFVEVAQDYNDFARAMRRKLLREIDPDPVVGLR
ncbi:MAG: DUF1194 domain-containing protein [Anderseniella sp.]